MTIPNIKITTKSNTITGGCMADTIEILDNTVNNVVDVVYDFDCIQSNYDYGNLTIQDDYILTSGNFNFPSNDLNVEGDIKIKGKSLIEMINSIEERLAILHPNQELESRWETLKALGEQYRKLEKEIIEKEKVWNILKK